MPFWPAARTALRRLSVPQCSEGFMGSHRPSELRGARLSGGPYTVRHTHIQPRIVGADVHVDQIDDVAQPALQRRLQCELHGGRELRTVWGKHELQNPAAEIRTVYALARAGKHELLDHVADVIVRVRRRSASSDIQVERVVD